MMLYLQSAVVMMDCLTVLSIISHTHKHNNNEANIMTVQMFGLHKLQFQNWHYIHRIRHGKCCNTARPPRSQSANQNHKSRSPGSPPHRQNRTSRARHKLEYRGSGSGRGLGVALAGHELGDVGSV